MEGASVSATASPANRDFLRRHGAALALDYRDPVAVGQHGPWDLILDLMGGAVGEQALGWLAPNGRMVTVPTSTAAQLLEKASGMARKVLDKSASPTSRNWPQLATLVDNGQLRLHVSAALALEEAASAHEKMQGS